MAPCHRLLAAVALCALAGDNASAQFRRGLVAEGVEINLFPAVPPTLLLPPGTFEVSVKNQSTAPERLLTQLGKTITTQLAQNDSRLRVSAAIPELQVVATLTGWTHSRRHSTRYVPGTRQIGTEQVTDGDGRTRAEAVYDYGRNKPNVIDEGAATVRIEVRRGTQILVNETARVTYHSDRLVDEGAPSQTEIEDALIDRAARRSAGVVTPAREPVKVFLARSDEVENLNHLALSRKWSQWLSALQAMRPHRDAKRDSYRLYNLGIAHEAMAYEAISDDDAERLLEEAAGLVQQAIAARKDEKYFTEASTRITANSLGYTRIRAMRERR